MVLTKKLKRLNLREELPRQVLILVLTLLFLSCDALTPTKLTKKWGPWLLINYSQAVATAVWE